MERIWYIFLSCSPTSKRKDGEPKPNRLYGISLTMLLIFSPSYIFVKSFLHFSETRFIEIIPWMSSLFLRLLSLMTDIGNQDLQFMIIIHCGIALSDVTTCATSVGCDWE